MNLRESGPVVAITSQLKALPAFESVPHEKVATMLLRTFIGAILLLVGLLLIGVEMRVLLVTKDTAQLSLWVLGAGLALLVLGPTVWSTQIVVRPFQVTIALLKSVADIVRNTP